MPVQSKDILIESNYGSSIKTFCLPGASSVFFLNRLSIYFYLKEFFSWGKEEIFKRTPLDSFKWQDENNFSPIFKYFHNLLKVWTSFF